MAKKGKHNMASKRNKKYTMRAINNGDFTFEKADAKQAE